MKLIQIFCYSFHKMILDLDGEKSSFTKMDRTFSTLEVSRREKKARAMPVKEKEAKNKSYQTERICQLDKAELCMPVLVGTAKPVSLWTGSVNKLSIICDKIQQRVLTICFKNCFSDTASAL